MSSKKTKVMLSCCLLSYAIISSLVILASEQNSLLVSAQSVEQQQQKQQQQQQQQPASTSNSGNKTNSYVYGCGEYGEAFHCDPFLTELESYRMIGRSSKAFPIVNDNPVFTTISNATTGTTGNTIDSTVSSSKQHQGPINALEMLDRNREVVEIANNDSYSSDTFSVAFWTKKISDTSPRGHVISHTNRDTTAGWFFEVITEITESSSDSSADRRSLSFVLSSNSSDAVKTRELPISESSLTHIAGTFDGKTARLYQNGELFDSVQYNGTYINDPKLPIHIGSAAYCSSCNRWSGLIGDLRIYNNTLSDSEIKEISSSPSSSSSASLSGPSSPPPSSLTSSSSVTISRVP